MMPIIRHFLSLFPVLLLLACSPTQQDYRAADGKAVRMDAEAFHLSDADALPYRSWLPQNPRYQKNPKAVIVGLHGFNDYSYAFDGTGAFFSNYDMAVYAYDQRGFGKTEQLGIWGSEENLVNDLKQFVLQLKAKYPKSPLYILGESMGGAVTISSVADPSFPKVDGVMLVAPAVWGAETMNPIFRGTLWVAAHTLPFRELTGNDLKIIASNNYPMLWKMSLDPLVLKKSRVDAVYGMVQLMDSAYEKIPAIEVPVLFLYGAKDQVIPPFAVMNALKRFKVPVTYAYYPDGYHMLLRDLQGEDVMIDMLSWLRQHNRPLPSGFSKMIAPGPGSELPL